MFCTGNLIFRVNLKIQPRSPTMIARNNVNINLGAAEGDIQKGSGRAEKEPEGQSSCLTKWDSERENVKSIQSMLFK